jgi:predicted secreted protein
MSEHVVGYVGLGTEFLRHDGSEFQKVARVFNIAGPGFSREIVDATTYDSVDGYRDKLTGLRDGGQITFSLNFLRPTFLVFKADFESNLPVQYRLILPDDDNTTLTFLGFVTEMPLAVPEGDRITVDVTIEISGKVEDDDS